MIIPTLLAEAEKLGIIKQQGESILKQLGQLRAKKLSKIRGSLINRNTSMAFSAEMAGIDGQLMLDIENLQESNGSVGHSPSATAYFSLYVRQQDKRALEYLRKTVKQDGGVPNVASFDAFEISWTLWNLRLIPGLQITPRIESLLDMLANAWQPNRGIGFATEYSVKDSDMTSMVFDTLLQYGYKKDIESILGYEEQDYFRCYPLEANPSISANIHVLGALRRAGYKSDHPSIQKIIRFLKQKKSTNSFWIDKWQSSPYYTTSHAIIACAGYADDLVQDSVEWIISSQRAEGAWGNYFPTAEETAYAIQALWVWNQNSSKIPASIIRKGIEWLEDHLDGPYPPLWIGKCLYSPNLVVHSTVVSAFTLGKQI
jgi:halimadienyl-diphosphate synthase